MSTIDTNGIAKLATLASATFAKIHHTHDYVRNITEGQTNGTINYTIGLDTFNASVKGLKSAAYTESSAYAAYSHTHDPNEISLTQYTIAVTPSAINSQDTINSALGKLEAAVNSKTAIGHTHSTENIIALTNYSKPNDTSALSATDTLNEALGKLEKALDGKQSAGNYVTSDGIAADSYKLGGINATDYALKANIPTDISAFNNDTGYITTVSWADVTNKPAKFDPSQHTHGSNEITVLTNYTKSSTASAIAATDSLNTALGKLEAVLDTKQVSGNYLTPDSTLNAAKLSGTIPSECYTDTVYIHPSNPGNKHIPSGGGEGQILRWAADGVAAWGSDNNTQYAAGSGLSLSGSTFNHASTVTAGTAGATSATSGVSLAVPYITYNETGHITATGTRTHTVPNMTGASASADGAVGLVPAPTQGNQDKFLRADGTWQAANNYIHPNTVTAGTVGTSSATSGITLAVPYVTYNTNGHITATGTHTHTVSSMTGATAAVDGAAGLVPTPVVGDQNKFLCGDATWRTPQDTVYIHPTSGVTAGSYGPNANVTPSYSDTFYVPYITVDENGHIITASTKSVKLPADSNTDTKVTNTLATTTKAYVTGTTSATTSTGTQVFDTGVYLSETAGELVATKFTGALNGNANTASKISTSAKIGDTNKPVYIAADGTVTPISYTIDKSVPSNAVFTDTNNAVTNTLGTTTKFYVTGTTSATTSTGGQYFDTGVYVSTTAGELVATKFTGALNGNANTASKINTSAKIGDTNKPVYIAADGTVTPISYTVDKSVPSNAVFTDTNNAVTNTLGTTTKFYITGTTSTTTNTGGQIFDTGVYVSATAGELVATKFTGALNGKANDSDKLGGTAASSYALKSYVDTAVANVVNSAPEALDTLNELSAALGNDPNFATTIATQIGGKVATGSADYIKSASVSGKTLTLTKGNNTTVTFTETNTQYSAGSGLSLSGTTFSANGSAIINALTENTSPATRSDYIVAQYAGGGTTTTTYHRRSLENIFKALNASDITTALGYVPSGADTTYSAGSGLSLSGTTFNHASTVTAGTAGTSSATSGITLAVPYVTYNATGHITAAGTHTHTVPNMTAASSSAAGAAGLVPAPAKGDQAKFLRADGTWQAANNYTHPNDGANTGSFGPSDNASPGHGTKFNVPYITVNAAGHVTAASTKEITLPAQYTHPNTVTAGTVGTSTATSGSTLAVPYVTYNANGHITATGTHTHTVSGFLPSTGGTLTGGLIIEPPNGSFTEGVRIAKSPAGWATIILGCNRGTTSGSPSSNGGWWFGQDTSNQFILSNSDGTTGNAALWIKTDKTVNIGKASITTLNGVTVGTSPKFTDTTYSAGTGLSLSSTTFSLATSGVTAGSYGPTANVSGSNGTTINVPQITVDAYGRVTSVTNREYTSVNTDTNTDTKNTAGSTDTSSKIFLIGATSQAANPQTYSDNEIYATNGVLTTKSVQVGGTACTLQYNATNKCVDFVFAA